MKKIRRDDEVIVITGKDKGKTGKVKSVSIHSNGRRLVVVSGINLVKKHTKPNPNKGIAGGIVEQEAALDASNIAILNPDTNKADRVGFIISDDGIKSRAFKSTGKIVGE